MKPQFTIPCFVKVTDAGKMEEVVNKLLTMGYLLGQHSYDPFDDIIVTYPDIRNTFCVGSEGHYNEIDFKDRADCGENIPLFITLAGMEDDTDDGQYFTDGKDWYKHISSVDIFGENDMFLSRMLLNGFHKATAEEIIKHFKSL